MAQAAANDCRLMAISGEAQCRKTKTGEPTIVKASGIDPKAPAREGPDGLTIPPIRPPLERPLQAQAGCRSIRGARRFSAAARVSPCAHTERRSRSRSWVRCGVRPVQTPLHFQHGHQASGADKLTRGVCSPETANVGVGFGSAARHHNFMRVAADESLPRRKRGLAWRNQSRVGVFRGGRRRNPRHPQQEGVAKMPSGIEVCEPVLSRCRNSD